MRNAALAILLAAAAACTETAKAPSIAEGPGSGLDADLVDGQHASEFAQASGLSVGAITPEQSRRLGAFTDLARGRRVTVSHGSLGGVGPTSEFAKEGYWSTTNFPSTMTLDLGGAVGVDRISFESHWRGDVRYIPSYEGAGAYLLSISTDNATWTDLPAVAPVDGDHFVHVLPGADVRYVRLTVIAPAVMGNPVNVTMFRVLNYGNGEATQIDSRRSYFADGTGPFCIFAKGCPTGWTDRGTAGIIYENASGTSPYNTGGAYSAGWTWIHPRLCCR